MNPIERILSAISDDDLLAMLQEMESHKDNGTMPDGEINAQIAEIVSATGTPRPDASNIVLTQVPRLAARRWVAARESLQPAAQADPSASANIQIHDYLGLRCRKTGAMVRLGTREEEEQGSPRFLSADPAFAVFQAQSLSQIRRILAQDTPWYNATDDQPSWGDFDGYDLIPLKVRVSTSMEDVELPPVLSVKTVNTTDTHEKVAKLYAGRPIEREDDGRLVVWLAERPEGMSLADMKSWEGELVYTDATLLFRRKVYAVCEVPEESVALLKGKPGVLLIASGFR